MRSCINLKEMYVLRNALYKDLFQVLEMMGLDGERRIRMRKNQNFHFHLYPYQEGEVGTKGLTLTFLNSRRNQSVIDSCRHPWGERE